MVSKAKIKWIRSLEMKKNRDREQLFVAEGNKLVSELIGALACEWMLAEPSWMATQGHLPARELEVAEEGDLRKVSLLKSPQQVLAVFRRPAAPVPEGADRDGQLMLALDGIQDPGNLGTIIRLADWFGIEHVVCSPDTADAFGPKAVQSTMGALARVGVHYTELESFLQGGTGPRYGAFAEGDSLYAHPLSSGGILIMGNEGNGIRPSVEALIDRRLCIPSFPASRTGAGAESLNVAVATGIICAEFRRPQKKTYSAE
ncbi:MAG: RNA methyltransferase [Tannerella sp.]|jgi:TrmH family RNA methyltransferase|nr:RNA methyltransferase [Tannerella sp.]